MLCGVVANHKQSGMNIAFVSSHFFLDHVVPLLNALAAEHRIVLYLADAGEGSGFYSNSRDWFQDRVEYEHLKELDPRVEVAAVILPELTTKSLGSCRVAWQMISHIRKNQFDVCHLEDIFTLFLPLLLIRKMALIVDIHDPIPHTGEPPSQFQDPRTKIFVRWCRRVIIHSEHQRIAFEARYDINQHKVSVIHLGVLQSHTARTTVDVKEDGATVLFFGRISPYKGLEYLAQAWPSIRQAVPNARLIIAGGGEPYFDMSTLMVDERVEIYHRYVSDAELGRFLRRASVVVLPYLDATQSGVVLTAYAFNKPVVATNVDGLANVVEDRAMGLLVPPRNPERLSEAILTLLNDPDLRGKMSRAIQERVRTTFAWDKIAAETIDSYKKAITPSTKQ